jgi:type IV pilus assembly protein PilB
MAEQKTQNYYDISEDAMTIQSILDVFVLQNILDSDDATKLKEKLKTNRQVEEFMLKNRILTRDTINKAYSIIYKLPFIELKSVKIPDELKQIIPERVARKFFIIPFDQYENTIKIAIARPADLLASYQNGLSKLLASKELDLELFITGETDFYESVKQYRKNSDDALLVKKGSLPVVYLRNQVIPNQFLKKIPEEFITKYRLVVFGENKKGYYLVACEDPTSPVSIKILDFIQRENNIKIERFATSKEDINYIISLLHPQKKVAPISSKTQGSANTAPKQAAPSLQEENISENPKLKNKDVLSSLLNAFTGNGGPAFTIDEIPNADLVSGDGTITLNTEKVSDEKASSEPVDNSNEDNTTSKENVSGNQENTENVEVIDQTPVVESAEGSTPKTDKSVETLVVDKDQGPMAQINAEVAAETKKEVAANDRSADASSRENEVSGSEGEKTKDLSNKDIGALLRGDVKTIEELQAIANEGFVPKIVAAVVNFALNQRASDIHVEPEANILRVRCRIDGILTDILRLPIKYHPPYISRIKIMSRLKIDETRVPQDGRFDIVLNNREVDVRVSTLPTVHGEKIVMRILDKSKGILSLEDLGMMGSAIDRTVTAIKEPYGIVLVTGPTGSGKSTTLYAVLSRISTPDINIVTLEDPVEYQMPGINQCQIKPEIGFTFASGLRSILRQDPNVIMVGEIRDAETASMATQAALTGHLVLSTLHTNDTAGALPRLINMGIEPFLITSSINLVLAQRLVRRICPNCKEEMKVPQKLIDNLYAEIKDISAENLKDRERIPATPKLFYGKGCSECNHGYRGRVGLYEVMPLSEEIEELTIARKPADDIKASAIKDGMITMRQDGILKAFAGLTTVDEVMQAVIVE